MLINILKYKFSYQQEKYYPLPLSLTLNLTNKCNLRCKTCKIWKEKNEEMSSKEYEKIFKNINKKILWITLTGGEVFLRADLQDIILNIHKYLKPGYLNIPTNGMMTDIIIKNTENILKHCKNIKLKINLSIDDIGEKQNNIRGNKNSFNNVVNTFIKLKKLKNKNLTVGIGTVLSSYNVQNYKEIGNLINLLQPDSFVYEIAQVRREFNNLGERISPDIEKYKIASNYFNKNIKIKSNFTVNFFRKKYYTLVMKTLRQQKQIIPCFAGIASGYVTADGKIWQCPTKGDILGNLRDESYDFKKIWQSEEANKIRKKIKYERCFCMLANAYYTNILLKVI